MAETGLPRTKAAHCHQRKRARVEGAGAEHCAEPNEEARRWGIRTFRTQEKWSATRRAVPITEDAEHVEMQRGETKGYMHHPRKMRVR